MPRNLKPRENQNKAKARRAFALERNELRQDSVPRVSAAGVTSAPLKAEDPAIRAMIVEAVASRRCRP